MRLSLIVVILLAGCGGAAEPAVTQVREDAVATPPGAAPDPAHAEAAEHPVAQAEWNLQSSAEGAALVLTGAAGRTKLRLFCPAGSSRWLVNAPGFTPIGSEERFSFGHASRVATLVADTAGDAERGGVTGQGPVPEDLRTLLSVPVSASYGAQVSGPHAAPSSDLLDAFANACRDAASPTSGSTSAGPPSTQAPVNACRMQDGRAIPANALRAVGTEPFWGVRVDGRCVTYSHPDDQTGTRVWTQFSGTASAGNWTGALRGKPFVMRTRAQGCSDGMSDMHYPITVTLAVGGEQRSGCAAPR